MRTLNGHFVVKGPKITHCCFCDRPIQHIRKTQKGKVFLCKCGASFIWPIKEEKLDNKLAKILQFAL